MKSQDRPTVVSHNNAASAHRKEDYFDFPVSSQSEQRNLLQTANVAKFNVYGFLFRSAIVLIVLAFLFVVAIYYRVINP